VHLPIDLACPQVGRKVCQIRCLYSSYRSCGIPYKSL
jgi:hypothetical protein